MRSSLLQSPQPGSYLFRNLALLASLYLVAGGLAPPFVRAGTAGDAAAQCKALGEVDFSSVSDAQITVRQGKWVAAGDGEPDYCEVNGYVAPRVEFLLRLPVKDWNGKLIELGCAGGCGTLDHIRGCADPMRRGYACIVSDGGHKTNALQPMAWARHDPPAAIEYLIRSSHVTAIAGKAIVRRYYGRTPRESYFAGCSAGGIQAMSQAQRFPWDFDGIVAGAPALSLSSIWVNWIWANRALTGADGKAIFDATSIAVLHRAVVARCDMNDGIQDGLIGDPRECQFDPAELHCVAGRNNQCLSAAQIEAATKIYGGPVTSRGEHIAAPLALRGSELTWLGMFAGSAHNPTFAYTYMKDWSGYALFDIDLGRDWKPEDFDIDRDYQRLGAMQALESFSSPDLRRFKAAGGKLLLYSGWADPIEGVMNTIDYFQTAERVMGGPAATQDFLRLFVVPGMNHCGGGEGVSNIDWLTALESWVEQGQRPEVIIGTHVGSDDSAQTRFSRPVFPYPAKAKYRGRGDPSEAASFIAENPR